MLSAFAFLHTVEEMWGSTTVLRPPKSGGASAAARRVTRCDEPNTDPTAVAALSTLVARTATVSPLEHIVELERRHRESSHVVLAHRHDAPVVGIHPLQQNVSTDHALLGSVSRDIALASDSPSEQTQPDDDDEDRVHRSPVIVDDRSPSVGMSN